MHRVRIGSLGRGGKLFAAVGITTTLVVVACAQGTTGGVGLDDDAGIDAGERDVNVVPTPDDGSTSDDADTGMPPGDSSTCDKKVVINELMSDGASASDEFVELYNPGTCAVALAGWTLKYESASGGAGSAGYVFVAADSIAAKGYFLLASGAVSGTKDGTWISGMAAAAGQVALLDDKSVMIDAVGYGTITGGSYHEKTSAPAPVSGGSIGRIPNGTDSDSNSADFKKIASPTPRAAN